MCISLAMSRACSGMRLRAAECCGMENCDVERSRRAISDARYEFAAQHVRRYVTSIAR